MLPRSPQHVPTRPQFSYRGRIAHAANGNGYLGPSFSEKKTQQYVLVIADYMYFTKWSDALPNMEAEMVSQAFVHQFVCQFGVPDFLYTDQGKNLNLTLTKEICRLLGIQKTRTTASNPSLAGWGGRQWLEILSMVSTLAEKDFKH